jgi:hypothetical protein
MESVHGSFVSCGVGKISFNFTCTGSDCDILSTFSNVTCHKTNDGASTICSNGVACSSPPSYSSNFTMSETGGLISMQKTVDLGDCGAYNYATNGSVYDNSTSVTRQRSQACHLERNMANSTAPETASGSTYGSTSGTASGTSSRATSGATHASRPQKAIAFLLHTLVLLAFFANPTWALKYPDTANGDLTGAESLPNLDQSPNLGPRSMQLMVRDSSPNNDQNPWLTEVEYIAAWWTTNVHTTQGADLKEQYKETIIAGAKSIACHASYDPLPDNLLHFDVFDSMCMALPWQYRSPPGL